MKKAIVTLAIGSAFKARWETLCGNNWKEYAVRHGCDLIVIDQPLDVSIRAQGRSPSWQKCLLLEHPEVRKYDQVAWVDCDIFFNPWSKVSLFDGVPQEMVGAVNSFEDPSFTENAAALTRLWPDPGKTGDGTYHTPEEIYSEYGPPVKPQRKMLNAGVLVASPRCHDEVWRHVYETYEDRGSPSYYENVPLSFELVKRDLVYWMDPRFNHLWVWSKVLHYPFLQEYSKRTMADKFLRRFAKWSGNDYEERVAVRCATAALLNCHLLHFAGSPGEMRLVDLAMAAQGNVSNLGI